MSTKMIQGQRIASGFGALLVRVGADLGVDGGRFNGLVDVATGEFAYLPIPESKAIRPGMAHSYKKFSPALSRFGANVPEHLDGKAMHLDPDFEQLTYGDQGQRARQIESKIQPGGLLVFYAGLRDSRRKDAELIYAIIGLYRVSAIRSAQSVPKGEWNRNAHTRRILSTSSDDIVVSAMQGTSGRLKVCIPIGAYRPPSGEPNRPSSYRVREELLVAWGGLSVKDGYIQRSARLPQFLDPGRFYRWFLDQQPILIQRNN